MSKEIEFKVKLTKEEAKSILERWIRNYCRFETVLKTDDYWKSSDGKTMQDGKVIRLRSTYEVGSVTMGAMYTNDVGVSSESEEDLLFKWFFDPYVSEFPLLSKLPRESYVTYKQKALTPSAESNEEYESKVDLEAATVIERCYDALGKRYFSKFKRCCSMYNVSYTVPVNKAHSGTINIDLDNVSNMYYFEIEFIPDEYTGNDALTQNEAITIMENIAIGYGVNPENKDNRPWVKILGINE